MGKHIREEYYLTIIEGVSPLTRIPTTPYRVAGLGILKEVDCDPDLQIPKQPPLQKFQQKKEPKECSFKVTPTVVAGGEGDEIQFTFSHEDSGAVELHSIYNSDLVEDVGGSRFRLLREGNVSITFVATYEDGRECKAEVGGVIQEGREGTYQEDIDVVVCPSETVEVGRVTVPLGFTGDLEIGMRFSDISGSDFPDLNIKSPIGETFGYQDQFLNSSKESVDTSNMSSNKATYTGYAPTDHDEKFVFERPVEGEWVIYAQNKGGNQKSEVSVFVSDGVDLVVTYTGSSC